MGTPANLRRQSGVKAIEESVTFLGVRWNSHSATSDATRECLVFKGKFETEGLITGKMGILSSRRGRDLRRVARDKQLVPPAHEWEYPCYRVIVFSALLRHTFAFHVARNITEI